MISAAGLRALGATLDIPGGPSADAYQACMAQRSSQIGDVQPSDVPTQWLAAFQPNANDVHLLVAIASDEECDLDRRLVALYDEVQTSGCAIVYQEHGATLPAPLTGHEHFGFKDGVSQPAIVGDDPPGVAEPPAVPPGEFVLGYPDSQGNTVGAGTRWANSSYVVFRRLRQNVQQFRNLVAA